MISNQNRFPPFPNFSAYKVGHLSFQNLQDLVKEASGLVCVWPRGGGGPFRYKFDVTSLYLLPKFQVFLLAESGPL